MIFIPPSRTKIFWQLFGKLLPHLSGSALLLLRIILDPPPEQLNHKDAPDFCLSNRRFERLGDPLDEIVTVSVAQIQRHNATS